MMMVYLNYLILPMKCFWKSYRIATVQRFTHFPSEFHNIQNKKLVCLCFVCVYVINIGYCLCYVCLLFFRTCKHFLKLVEDRRLWKTFDFATKRMMGRQIKKLLSTLQVGDIEACKVRGFVTKYSSEKWKNNTITVNILRKLSSCCPCLETLEIREGYINFQKVWLSLLILFDTWN